MSLLLKPQAVAASREAGLRFGRYRPGAFTVASFLGASAATLTLGWLAEQNKSTDAMKSYKNRHNRQKRVSTL